MRSFWVFGVFLAKNVDGSFGEKVEGALGEKREWCSWRKKLEGSLGEKPGRLEKNLPGLDLGCQLDFGAAYFEIRCSVFEIRYFQFAFLLMKKLEGSLGEKSGKVLLTKNLEG